MYRKRNYRRATRRPRRRYGRKARLFKKKFSPALKKFVLKTIHRNIENKTLTNYAANAQIAYAGSVTNPTFLYLVPTPTQGTTTQNRVGNEIRVVKANIKGLINMLPYSATNPQYCPVWVKMWLVSRKQNQFNNAPSSTDFSNFFQAGQTSFGFQSNTLDMLFEVNKDYFTLHKTMKFQLANMYPSTGAITIDSGSIIPASSQVSVPFSFNFERHLGICKFNDTETYPRNKDLILVFQAVNADGTTNSLGTAKAEVHYTINYYYEDA